MAMLRKQLSDYEDVEHPSTGGHDDPVATERRLFWESYRFAVRNHVITAWLARHQAVARLGKLMAEVEQMRCRCGAYVEHRGEWCKRCQEAA